MSICSTVDNTNGLLIACQGSCVLIVVCNGCDGEQVSRGKEACFYWSSLQRGVINCYLWGFVTFTSVKRFPISRSVFRVSNFILLSHMCSIYDKVLWSWKEISLEILMDLHVPSVHCIWESDSGNTLCFSILIGMCSLLALKWLDGSYYVFGIEEFIHLRSLIGYDQLWYEYSRSQARTFHKGPIHRIIFSKMDQIVLIEFL